MGGKKRDKIQKRTKKNVKSKMLANLQIYWADNRLAVKYFSIQRSLSLHACVVVGIALRLVGFSPIFFSSLNVSLIVTINDFPLKI